MPKTAQLVVAVGAALAAGGCATSGSMMAAEVARTNTQTVLAFIDTVFNKHQVQAGFDRYVGPTYKQHNPRVPDGRAASIQSLTYMLTNINPHMRVVIERTVAQGDLVAVHEFGDVKPGEARGSAVVDIFRLENGKIVEHWDVLQEVPENSANTNTMF